MNEEKLLREKVMSLVDFSIYSMLCLNELDVFNLQF